MSDKLDLEIIIPEQCFQCARRVHRECSAFLSFQKTECSARTTDKGKIILELQEMLEYNILKDNKVMVQKLKRELKALTTIRELDIKQVYKEELKRGSRGGQSESDSNAKTGRKQLLKDNRALETKTTQKDREDYMEAVKDWEEKNGKLDKLRPDDGVSKSKVDSYTGAEIPEGYKPKKPKKTRKPNMKGEKKNGKVKTWKCGDPGAINCTKDCSTCRWRI